MALFLLPDLFIFSFYTGNFTCKKIQHPVKLFYQDVYKRQYIESWVHEIKAPITSVALMCENHRSEITRRIRGENCLPA